MRNETQNERYRDLVEAIAAEQSPKLRTLHGALWSDFFEWFSDRPWMKVAGAAFILGGFLVIQWAIYSLPTFLRATAAFVSASHFAFLQVVGLSVLWWYRAKVTGWFKRDRRVVNDTRILSLYGVPVVELVDHLFEKQTFRQVEVMPKFAMKRSEYDELSDKLEEHGALVRGERNTHVLNPDITRQQVAQMISMMAKGETPSAMIRTRPNSYHGQPAMPTIEARVGEAIELEKKSGVRQPIIARRLVTAE